MKNRVRILESVYKIDEKKRFPHVGWDGQFTVRAKTMMAYLDERSMEIKHVEELIK